MPEFGTSPLTVLNPSVILKTKVVGQNNLRQRVYKLLGQHTKNMLHHFVQENVSCRTVYSILQNTTKDFRLLELLNLPGKYFLRKN